MQPIAVELPNSFVTIFGLFVFYREALEVKVHASIIEKRRQSVSFKDLCPLPRVAIIKGSTLIHLTLIVNAFNGHYLHQVQSVVELTLPAREYRRRKWRQRGFPKL